MARKTAGNAGESWDQKSQINGVYVQKKTDQGIHKSNVYVLEVEGGEKISVWGSTVLDTKFGEIPLHSEVWIDPPVDATSKNGTRYKDFNVEYDDEVPLAEAKEAAGGTPMNADETAEATNTFNKG